jgi:Flp pilus assembly protein TadD
MMRIAAIGATAALASSMAACASGGGGEARYTPGVASRPAATQETSESAISPDVAAARTAIAREDILAQMTYWAADYGVHPDDIIAARGFSEALRLGGRHDRAIEVAQESLRRMGEDAPLLRTLGLAQLAGGRPQEALRPLALVARADPQDVRTRMALGVALDQLGRFDQARMAYLEALAIAPDDVATLTNYGVSFLLTGEAEEAETILRQAAGLPNAPVETRQNLAIALGLQGEFEEAERVLRIDLTAGEVEQSLAYLRGLFEDPRSWGDLRDELRR